MIGTNHYIAIVGFEQDQLDKEGNPKIKKSKLLIEGVTFYDAFNTLLEYLKTDSRGYDIKSMSEAKFEDVVGQTTKSKVVKVA